MAGLKGLGTVRKCGKDAEAEEQGMEMAKKRTDVKFPGEKSFDGAHGTLFV